MSLDPGTGLDPALAVGYEPNWQDRLRQKIFAQFRGLPNIQALSDLIAQQTQDLEDAAQTLLQALSIPDASGVGLQLIGRIVGQAFAGEPDATYRLYLLARIRANLSDGSPEALYAVFKSAFGNGDPGMAQIVPYPPSPAALVFRVLDFPLDAVQAGLLFALLADSLLGGVRLVLEWPSADDADSFVCDEGSPGLGCDSGAIAGSLST
jgi:hypothetical protein